MSKTFSEDVVLIRRPKKILKKIGCFLLILLVMSVLIWGGNILSGLLVGREFNLFSSRKITIPTMNYYAIVFGEFEREEDAKNCAIWTASSGGGAYIYAKTTYLVVGQVYKTEEEAKGVVENFNKDLTYNAEVRKISLNKYSFKIENLNKSDRKDIIEIVGSINETISEILNISNDLDKSVISNVSASSKVNSIKSQIKITKRELEARNIDFQNDALTRIGDVFIKIEDSLDVCVNKLLSSETYNTVLKYCASEILFTYYDFCNNL